MLIILIYIVSFIGIGRVKIIREEYGKEEEVKKQAPSMFVPPHELRITSSSSDDDTRYVEYMYSSRSYDTTNTEMTWSFTEDSEGAHYSIDDFYTSVLLLYSTYECINWIL